MDDVHCGVCAHLRVFDDNFYPETHIAFAAANNLPRRFGAFTGEKGVVTGGQVDLKLLAWSKLYATLTGYDGITCRVAKVKAVCSFPVEDRRDTLKYSSIKRELRDGIIADRSFDGEGLTHDDIRRGWRLDDRHVNRYLMYFDPAWLVNVIHRDSLTGILVSAGDGNDCNVHSTFRFAMELPQELHGSLTRDVGDYLRQGLLRGGQRRVYGYGDLNIFSTGLPQIGNRYYHREGLALVYSVNLVVALEVHHARHERAVDIAIVQEARCFARWCNGELDFFVLPISGIWQEADRSVADVCPRCSEIEANSYFPP